VKERFSVDRESFPGPVVVTGAGGCIGSWVLALLARSGVKACAFDLSEDKRRPRLLMSEDELGKVQWRTGDISDTAAVLRILEAVRPSAIIHLAALQVPFCKADPVAGAKVNVVGTVNVFEAARRLGIKRIAYASSLAVSGQQNHFGDRFATEDDPLHGTSQYAMHKMFNEFQAQKYIKNYGMSIVGVRPANVTGPDKVRGSVDHVQIMGEAARGKPVHLPKKGLMRTLIHVEDIAEIFLRVLMAEAPRHHLYNSGGIPVSLGELADIVRGFLPDAKITFDEEGGREDSGNYLVDNSRLTKEFGIEFPGLHTRVLEVINDVRRHEGLPLVATR